MTDLQNSNDLTKLHELVSQAESHSEKFYGKSVKKAATDLRKTLQEIKMVSQALRLKILADVKSLPKKTKKTKKDKKKDTERDDDDFVVEE
jgi:hypothetical protein